MLSAIIHERNDNLTNFVATVYTNPADVKTAVDAIDDTTLIHVMSFMQNGKQKFMVVA